ncbi:transposase [Rhodococcus opacus]|uniref:transposase n=1 Tax=Rhodococcus opacus TaxID=37919 RepID=UPI000ADC5E08|nr:transposase [Rhodococcus opacus]
MAAHRRRAARPAAGAGRPGPVPDRGDHRLTDVPAADTVPRFSLGWDGGKRTNGVKRHIAVDVNGLLLAVVVTAAPIQDGDAAHPTPGRTAR